MTLFTRSKPSCLDPGDWPATARQTKARVLIENADAASAWAQAEILREAGYEVATCTGPTPLGAEGPHHVCPIVAGDACALVEGADVVVTSTELGDARRILAVHRSATARGLVVEGTTQALASEPDLPREAVFVEEPVTGPRLLAAVESALDPGR